MVKRGAVARILAGRDAGQYCVVLEDLPDAESWALVADGRRRKLRNPKRKNPRHLAVLRQVLPEEALATDRQIRRALHPYQFGTQSL